MPSRTALHLQVEQPGTVRPRHVRAFVTSLLEADTDDHHANIKPFTVDIPVETDAGIALVVSTLHTEADRSLLTNATAVARRGESVLLGQLVARFAPDPIEILQHADHEQLLHEAEARDTIHLEFTSPTVFRSGRRGQVPFPLPTQVFGHYRTRWNTFAPEYLACNLAFDDLGLSLVAFDGRGVPFADGHRRGGQIIDVTYLGYVGTATFRAEGRGAHSTARRWLNALAAYGEYAGTGANTTIGMGMTEVIGP